MIYSLMYEEYIEGKKEEIRFAIEDIYSKNEYTEKDIEDLQELVKILESYGERYDKI